MLTGPFIACNFDAEISFFLMRMMSRQSMFTGFTDVSQRSGIWLLAIWPSREIYGV